MATAKGVIKKCQLTVFDNPMSRGIIAMGLDEGDELVSVRLSDGDEEIFVATRNGKAIRFAEDDVRPMGRPARGVRSIKLTADDEVIGMEVVKADGIIMSISELGYGKRTVVEKYRKQSRGGQGVINMKTTAKVGKVLGILSVHADTDLMIITMEGKIIRIESGEVRKCGRGASGVRVVRMSVTDRVAAACVIPDPGEVENGPGSDNQEMLPLQ
jgi:DNA gyrase subunit A